MTVSKIATLSGQRGVRGLLVVEDQVLSGLLGDAEGPAHTEWGTGEARPDQKYVKWKRRVTFVRHGIAKLLSILAPPPEGLDEDWLQDIFAIEDPITKGIRKKKKRKKPIDPPPPPDPPPAKPQPFEMPDCAAGFRIIGTGDPDRVPEKISVRVAYDIADGNAFTAYSPIDFRFEEDQLGDLEFTHTGITFERRVENRLVFVPESCDFDLQVVGFDTNRDVLVKAVAEEAAE